MPRSLTKQDLFNDLSFNGGAEPLEALKVLGGDFCCLLAFGMLEVLSKVKLGLESFQYVTVYFC